MFLKLDLPYENAGVAYVEYIGTSNDIKSLNFFCYYRVNFFLLNAILHIAGRCVAAKGTSDFLHGYVKARVKVGGRILIEKQERTVYQQYF